MRDYELGYQNILTSGGLLAWREVFDLGAQTQDQDLMLRSLNKRQKDAVQIREAQQLYISLLEKKTVQDEIKALPLDTDSLSSDSYRSTLIQACFDVLFIIFNVFLLNLSISFHNGADYLYR